MAIPIGVQFADVVLSAPMRCASVERTATRTINPDPSSIDSRAIRGDVAVGVGHHSRAEVRPVLTGIISGSQEES